MNSTISLRAAMLAGAVVVAIAAPAPAVAQAIGFDIQAQDLAGALRQFAQHSNREILYSPDLVANLRTTGVSGVMQPEEALRRLLVGTNLTFRRTDNNVLVLQADARREAEAGSLRGVVTDATTGTPLAGAAVRIAGTTLSAVTNERGAYRFPAVPAGEYSVTLDYLGSPRQTLPVFIGGGESVLDFRRGGDAVSVSEVVVVGHRSAIQRALNQQRTASNASTIVSEDLLGGFPAETVSEALRRVPGVSFGRAEDTGEGSMILVRGFNSEAINVQVNGIDLQGTNFERTVDLSGYLAENISQVTIHKSLLPSHEATGSGGLVEIETRSGLDYGDFHLSGGVEGESALDSGFGGEYQANLTIGGRITPRFGIAATLAYRDTDRTNYDIFNNSSGTTPAVLPAGYTSVFLVPASHQFPFDPEFNNQLTSSATYIQRDRDETNLAASLNLAWDVADHTRLRLDVQHNRREAFTFFSRSAIQYLTTGVDMPIPELGGEVRRRFVLNSLRPGLSLASSDVELATTTVSLRGDTELDRWSFRYKAGYSAARQRSTNDDITFLGNTYTNLADLIDPAAIQYAPDGAGNPRIIDGGYVEAGNGAPIPALSAQGLDVLFDPAGYRISSAGRSITDSPTDAYFAEGSARYAFQTWLDYLEVGGKYDRSERSALDNTFATTTSGLRKSERFAPITGVNTFLSDIDPSLLMRRDLGLIGLGGFAVPSVSSAGNQALFRAMEGLLVDDPTTPFNEARFNFIDARNVDPALDPNALQPAGSVEERIAGYVEAHLEFGRFDIIAGARVERTERTGTAMSFPQVTLNTPTFQQEPRATFAAAGMIDFENLVATDTVVTPSFLVNYRPRDNVVARLGYFHSTVNPNIQMLRSQPQYLIDLRPAFNRGILREGNPDLEPTTTHNWDLDVAYYFQDTPGILRAAVFYKKINNNWTNLISTETPSDNVRQRILDHFAPLAATRPDLIAFNDDTQFFLNRPENGEGGVIWGVELEVIRQLDFLPGFFSDFGVIGNVTYTNGDFPTIVSGRNDQGVLTNFTLDRPLADQSEWVYNAALTYARGGLDARLIYTHQSASVTAYNVHDMNTIVPEYSTLDLRMSYNFGDEDNIAWSVFLEGDDLLNGADDPDIRSAISNSFDRSDASFFFPNTYQFSGGRMITLGLRARF